MNRISEENALPTMLATKYKSRGSAACALHQRWCRYVNSKEYSYHQNDDGTWRIVPVLDVMLAARYKSRQSAYAAFDRRWWKYVDTTGYFIQQVEGTTLWAIVPDPDGSIRCHDEKLEALANAMRAEGKGPSRKAQTIVNRIFTLNLNKKPKPTTQ